MQQKNLCRRDRIVRGVAGALLVAAALAFLRGIPALVAALGGGLLALSATVGFCHVYKVCGISTREEEVRRVQ